METNFEFTPAERLKIYKEILKRLNHPAKHYSGICFHLETILKKKYTLFEIAKIHGHLTRYFPELKKIPIGRYLFERNEEGNKKRIELIEKAIKEVEVIAKPFWKRFFSKLAFWK